MQLLSQLWGNDPLAAYAKGASIGAQFRQVSDAATAASFNALLTLSQQFSTQRAHDAQLAQTAQHQEQMLGLDLARLAEQKRVNDSEIALRAAHAAEYARMHQPTQIDPTISAALSGAATPALPQLDTPTVAPATSNDTVSAIPGAPGLLPLPTPSGPSRPAQTEPPTQLDLATIAQSQSSRVKDFVQRFGVQPDQFDPNGSAIDPALLPDARNAYDQIQAGAKMLEAASTSSRLPAIGATPPPPSQAPAPAQTPPRPSTSASPANDDAATLARLQAAAQAYQHYPQALKEAYARDYIAGQTKIAELLTRTNPVNRITDAATTVDAREIATAIQNNEKISGYMANARAVAATDPEKAKLYEQAAIKETNATEQAIRSKKLETGFAQLDAILGQPRLSDKFVESAIAAKQRLMSAPGAEDAYSSYLKNKAQSEVDAALSTPVPDGMQRKSITISSDSSGKQHTTVTFDIPKNDEQIKSMTENQLITRISALSATYARLASSNELMIGTPQMDAKGKPLNNPSPMFIKQADTIREEMTRIKTIRDRLEQELNSRVGVMNPTGISTPAAPGVKTSAWTPAGLYGK